MAAVYPVGMEQDVSIPENFSLIFYCIPVENFCIIIP
jgi:hypothetical protein